jgi:hypothetical protein
LKAKRRWRPLALKECVFMSIVKLAKDWFLFGLNQQGAMEEIGQIS